MKKMYIQPSISLKEMKMERALAAGSDILIINEDGSGEGILQDTGAQSSAMGKKKGIWQFFEE